jgi:hypothetical protein
MMSRNKKADMNKASLARFFNCFLGVIGSLFIGYAVLMKSKYPAGALARARTVNQFSDYRRAMNDYHGRYGRLPVHCTNITELTRMLDGENVNNDNPEKAGFFRRGTPLEKRIKDGFGFPFDLMIMDGGTNFILKSYGSRKRRSYEHFRGNPTSLMNCDIAMPCTQTLSAAEAQSRSSVQLVNFSATNLPTPMKETKHVDSINQ